MAVEEGWVPPIETNAAPVQLAAPAGDAASPEPPTPVTTPTSGAASSAQHAAMAGETSTTAEPAAKRKREWDVKEEPEAPAGQPPLGLALGLTLATTADVTPAAAGPATAAPLQPIHATEAAVAPTVPNELAFTQPPIPAII